MSSLILASTSPYRQALLSQLGFPFRVVKPPFDEEAAKSSAPKDPSHHALLLARGKAQSVLSVAEPQSIVIGGDQLVSFEGKILGKPHTSSGAVDQLLAMNGKTHELITAMSVMTSQENLEWVHTTRLTMRNLSRAQIEEYVLRDQPLDCAGSYKIEKHGMILFENIDCDDWSAIQGIPLMELAKVLIRLGLKPLEPGQHNQEKK